MTQRRNISWGKWRFVYYAVSYRLVDLAVNHRFVDLAVDHRFVVHAITHPFVDHSVMLMLVDHAVKHRFMDLVVNHRLVDHYVKHMFVYHTIKHRFVDITVNHRWTDNCGVSQNSLNVSVCSLCTQKHIFATAVWTMLTKMHLILLFGFGEVTTRVADCYRDVHHFWFYPMFRISHTYRMSCIDIVCFSVSYFYSSNRLVSLEFPWHINMVIVNRIVYHSNQIILTFMEKNPSIHLA